MWSQLQAFNIFQLSFCSCFTVQQILHECVRVLLCFLLLNVFSLVSQKAKLGMKIWGWICACDFTQVIALGHTQKKKKAHTRWNAGTQNKYGLHVQYKQMTMNLNQSPLYFIFYLSSPPTPACSLDPIALCCTTPPAIWQRYPTHLRMDSTIQDFWIVQVRLVGCTVSQ